MPDPIRVVLADDHAIFRAGLRALLELEDDLEVVGEAASGDEAVEGALASRPDVVVMDLSMPAPTASRRRGASRPWTSG
jgi:DNA-binding NarL/FixJ family response regulator